MPKTDRRSTSKTEQQLASSLLYSADIASIAASGTYSTTTYVNTIDCSGVEFIGIQPYATGHAGGAVGPITFNIITSVDGTHWGTIGVPVVLTPLNGTTPVIGEVVILDVRGLKQIKCLSVVNGDGAQQVDTINAYVYGYQ